MNFLSGFVSLAILVATSQVVSSVPITRRDVDESLIPQFGISPGVNPTGTGDCDGANGADGQPVKIPCSCPPDRATFIQSLNANVAAGHVVNNSSVPISFPVDNSTASQLIRINAATVTLQNLNGTGQGCPVASTTFQTQAAVISGPQVDGAILMPRQSAPSSPTPSLGVPGLQNVRSALLPLESIISALSPAPTPTSLEPAPSPTFSHIPIHEDILKLREAAPSPAPASEIDITGPRVVEDILKPRDSSPSPSATREIILTGPPVIKNLKPRKFGAALSSLPIPSISIPDPEVVGSALGSFGSALSPAPAPTFSVLPEAEGLLKRREAAPSPSATREIILTGPPVIENLKPRFAAPSSPPIPSINIPGPEVVGSALGSFESALSPAPTPTLPPINFPGPEVVGSALGSFASALSPAPTPTFSRIRPLEDILKPREPAPAPSATREIILTGPPVIENLKPREAAPSSPPTPTFSPIRLFEDILKPREAAPSSPPTPTFSPIRPLEDILKPREPAPAPSATREIILTGPPVIENL